MHHRRRCYSADCHAGILVRSSAIIQERISPPSWESSDEETTSETYFPITPPLSDDSDSQTPSMYGRSNGKLKVFTLLLKRSRPERLKKKSWSKAGLQRRRSLREDLYLPQLTVKLTLRRQGITRCCQILRPSACLTRLWEASHCICCECFVAQRCADHTCQEASSRNS